MEGNISPQKAIYQWLADTENCTGQGIDQLSEQPKEPDHIARKGSHYGHDVAKLRLRTPFRKTEKHPALHDELRPRERYARSKRRLDSTSEASAKELQQLGLSRGANLTQSSLTSSEHSDDERVLEGGLGAKHRKLESASPEPYRRRRRRKTKEDRYVLKEDSRKKRKAEHQRENGERKRAKRRRRNEKTGAALLHSFNAVNVASDKLTLKLPSKVGLFTKGKASSPYRRRALPDLCFSELRFLDGHRQPRECADRSEQAHNGRKRHKGLEQNEEFSKFFAAKESPSKPQPTNRATIGARRQYKPSNSKSPIKAPNVRLHSTSQPSLRAIDLPGRPFLGFGGRAPHSSSPVRPTIDVKPGSSPIKVRGGPISPLPQDQLPWPQSPIAPRMDLRRSAVMEKSDKVSSKHKADFTQQQGKSPTVHDGEANQAIEEMPTTANDVPRPNERIAPRSKLTLMQDQSAPTITKTISNNKTNDEHRRLFRHFATSSAHGTAVEDAVPLSDKEVPSKRYNIPAKSGLMDYLGEMIEERVGKEVQAALRPNNHPTIAPNETPMQMVDKRNEADHPTGQGKANLVDRQSEVEPPIKQGRHSSKHIERSDDQATPHNEKYGVRYDLGVHKVDKVCTETIDPDVPEQESVTIAQHPDVLTKRKANMPFPNIRASHLGLSLFMSPDSIYERQMQEDSFSQSPSVSTWGVSHLPSPILNRQSVSRSTFRPLSRHSAIARSRLSTARNRHNSIHQSISSNGPAGSLVAFYQTPSLSSFSPAAARGHAPFAPGSSERGRVLAASKRHQAETPQATSSQRQPPFAHEYEQQYSTVLEHEMHPNEPDQYPPTDFSPLPDNTFDAMPLRAEPSEFPHDDLNAPEVFEEEPLSPDVAMDYAAEVPAQHQNDAADEDFPADFWTPNKLY